MYTKHQYKILKNKRYFPLQPVPGISYQIPRKHHGSMGYYNPTSPMGLPRKSRGTTMEVPRGSHGSPVEVPWCCFGWSLAARALTCFPSRAVFFILMSYLCFLDPQARGGLRSIHETGPPCSGAHCRRAEYDPALPRLRPR